MARMDSYYEVRCDPRETLLLIIVSSSMSGCFHLDLNGKCNVRHVVCQVSFLPPYMKWRSIHCSFFRYTFFYYRDFDNFLAYLHHEVLSLCWTHMHFVCELDAEYQISLWLASIFESSLYGLCPLRSYFLGAETEQKFVVNVPEYDFPSTSVMIIN